MSTKSSIKNTAWFLGEFWGFLRVRKKWWLGPIIFMMLLFGFLIVMTEGSALAPFIYAIF